MSVTIKKPISKEKELFLAIALISGEVSSQTIRRMKVDLGESKIKNAIIQPLAKRGCITKVGIKSNYGYQLTEEGLEYLKIKFPNKYNYDLYNNSASYLYNTSIRERNRQSSMVLYTLAKQGVRLENNCETASNIIKGYNEVEFTEPFFVTSKEIKKTNIRLQIVYGSRIYGYIFTPTKIIAVYAPDKEHNLLLNREEAVTTTMCNMLKYAKPPYNDNRNYEILYMYNSNDDILDSFTVGDKINKRVPMTKRVYEKFKYKKSYIYYMDGNPYSLKDIFNDENKNKITDVYRSYFDLAEYKTKNVLSLHIDGIYDDEIPTYICWTLSPSTLIGAIEYCKQENLDKNEKILLLCFAEQIKILKRICNINKSLGSHIAIAELPSSDVYSYLNGEISKIN